MKKAIFIVKNTENKEVEDSENNLFWRLEAEPGKYNWKQAIAHAWKQAKADDKLWRLPSVEELKTLVWLDKNGRPNYPAWLKEEDREGWFWTSTPAVGYDGRAWVVGFGHGGVGRDRVDDRSRVLLVRS